MDLYLAGLGPGGELLISGILERDIPAISDMASSLGMKVEGTFVKDGWAVVCCVL